MNPNENDQVPSGGSAKGGPLKSLFTGIIYIFAFLAAIVIKPAQALKKEAYEKSTFSGFAFGAGIILSILGSIGSGYFGWQHAAPIQWWLGAAIVAPFAIYYYLWPLAFLSGGKWAFKFANYLWDRVADVKDSDSKGPKWLSYLLTGLTQAAIVAASLYLWWSSMHGIEAAIGWDNFFGWGISGLIAAVIAFIAGFAVSAAMYNDFGMLSFAVISGGALTYFYGYDLSAWLPTHLPSFLQTYAVRYATAVRHTGEGLQFLLWVGYVFPLGHIVISRMFNWVGKYYTKLMDKTYNDSDHNYLGFLSQVVNIGATGLAAYHAYGYAGHFGFGLWLTAPATAVAALLAYLIGGALLGRWSNVFVGVVASLGTGYLGFAHSLDVVPFGVFGAIGVGLVSALASGFLLFPVAYQLVKFLTNRVIASWLGQPLVELYKTISSEVFSSIEKTYDDETAYASFFVHVVNIAAAVGVYLLAGNLVSLIHLSGWMAISLPVLLTAFSYLFVGRLLVAYKTALIGTLAAIATGAFVGVEVFAHFDHNWWYAGGSFIAAGLAFAFGIFPVSYVIVRAGLELIAISKWATPALAGLYKFFFGFVEKFWIQFMIIYRKISLSFAPAWASVSRQFDEAWKSAMETFDKAFNSKGKK